MAGTFLPQTLLGALLLMNGFFFGTVSSPHRGIFFLPSWSSYWLILCSNNDSVSERIPQGRVIQFSYYTQCILKQHFN